MTDILWIDLETTGLGPGCTVIECAAVLTDDLGVERWRIERVFHPGVTVWEPVARQMHDASGLSTEAEAAKHVWHTFDGELSSRLTRTVQLGGHSVQFDRRWMDELFATSRMLLQRQVDARTLETVAEAAGVKLAQRDVVAHRAMADIEYSIAVYRSMLNVLQR